MKDYAIITYYLRKGLHTKFISLFVLIALISAMPVLIGLCYSIASGNSSSMASYDVMMAASSFMGFGVILALVSGGVAASALRQQDIEIFLAKPVSRAELFGSITGAHLLVVGIYWLLTSMFLIYLMQKVGMGISGKDYLNFIITFFYYLLPFLIILLIGSRMGNYAAFGICFLGLVYPSLAESIDFFFPGRKLLDFLLKLPLLLIPDFARFPSMAADKTMTLLGDKFSMSIAYVFTWFVFLSLSALILFRRHEIPSGGE